MATRGDNWSSGVGGKRGLAATAAVVVLAAGCWHGERRPVRVLDVTSDGTTLGVVVSACNARGLKVEIEETATEVRLSASHEGSSRDDCTDGQEVRLAEPLADRRVVDGSTGQEVRIAGP